MSVMIHLSSQQRAMIDDLLSTGNFGETHSDVVAYLVKRSLDDMLRAGVLAPPLVMVAKPRKKR